MPKMVASRNLRICTKDCMCLYVCPTGATDTETGQVDFSKCVGCGDCASISMIPLDYPHQQPKDERVKEKVRAIARSKAAQENIAKKIAESADDPGLRILMTAVRRSDRLMGEDLIRETGRGQKDAGVLRRRSAGGIPGGGREGAAVQDEVQLLNRETGSNRDEPTRVRPCSTH